MDLLRRSGRHGGTEYELGGVVHTGGSGVAHEAELLAFADAVIDGDRVAIERARNALEAKVGAEAVTDAAGVIAGFDAITRVADGTGIPLEPPKAEASVDWRASLGVDTFWSAKV